MRLIGVIVSCVLVLMTVCVYWHAPYLGFVSFDDPVYFAPQLPVWEGMTLKSIRWMFTETFFLNWHPMTWLSYMLDMKMFGRENPGGFHVTNVVIHTANVLLLFFAFWRMTSDLWKSAFVAAVFAVHPLHVESVAWLSERKDLLSTFFCLLAILAYVRYVQQCRGRWFWAAWVAFALSLMSKQMFVTLPFLLLLLDYWPLGRCKPRMAIDDSKPAPEKSGLTLSDDQDFDGSISWKESRRLILEKWPFFLLMIFGCVIAVNSQQKVIVTTESMSLWERLQNVVVVYGLYLVKTIWPSGLAAYYPFPAAGISMMEVAFSGALLIVITFIACWQAVRHPYFLIGWLWYLGMLVPVIGLVQIGSQRMADRYTYVPQIGLTIIAAWLIPVLFSAGIWRRRFVPISAAVFLMVMMVIAQKQVTYWKDGLVLFERVLAVVGPNSAAHLYLGIDLNNRGRTYQAIHHYREAIRLAPDSWEAHKNMGDALSKIGQIDEAILHYRKAISLAPHHGKTYNNLGNALSRIGQIDEAILYYRKAISFSPQFAQPHNNLGNAFCRLGRVDEGISHYKKALRLAPNYPRAHINLGYALLEKEQFDEAIEHFREAGRLEPTLANVEGYIAIAEKQRQQKLNSTDKLER